MQRISRFPSCATAAGIASAVALASLLGPHRAEAQPGPPPGLVGFGALGVSVDVQEEQVPFEARTFDALLRSLEQTPGWGVEGVRAHAVTLSALAPRWGLHRDESGCRVEDPWVETDILIRMPQWLNYASAPSSDQGSWFQYRRALLAHEHAHRDITIEGAARMVLLLREAWAPTCPRLVERIRGAMRRTRAEIDTLHAELDRGRPRRSGVR